MSARIFGPAANRVARGSLVLFAALPVAVIFLGSAISRSPYNTKVGTVADQPIPFSHRHHAWELGIDCRYCHTSVEESAYAGIPSTETCMTCHSQIWTNSPLLEPVRQSYETGEPLVWNRLNKVPEFVYFNHSIHIAKGVSCNNCHGPVQEMHLAYKARAFQMAWCLECHRNPEEFLYEDPENPDLTPRQQVFNLYLKNQTDPEGKYMTAVERKLLRGYEQRLPSSEIEEGRRLVQERAIKTVQLEDCAVCHH